ncbi:hypothetical protein LguiA_017434 [Lonicera macranthoides]
MSRPINKEWMKERNRLSQVYRHGVEEFIEYAIANDVLKLSTILCPCIKCRNKLRFPAVDIRKHLIKNGINKTYTQWLLHGEDPSFISMDQHPPLGHAELEEDIGPIDNNGDIAWNGEFSDEGPLLEDKTVILGGNQFQQIRRWVLFRLDVDGMHEYYSEYKQYLASHGKGKGIQMSKIEEQTSFIPWAYEKEISIMSSGAGSKNPTSSSAPAQTQSSTKKAVNGKKPIKVEMDGTVVGEFASNWSTRAGDIIRSIVPVHYKDWRQVPKNFRNDVWKNLMAEFELDIPPEVARPMLEKAWPQKFRTGKIALRAHLKSGAEGPPDGMDPIIWEKFVENENDPKKKKQSVQNSENRKQLTYSHTLGRCTYGLKIYKMEKADPSQTYNNRTDKWLAGHEDKNGCVLESAKPFYDKVKEAKLKRKSGEASSNTTEIDELSEVFGEDKRGRARGVGSHVTKKQLIHLGIAKAKEEVNKVEKEGINALKDEFKSYVQEAVKVQFQDFQLAIQGTMQNMMADLNRGSPHVTTPRKMSQEKKGLWMI